MDVDIDFHMCSACGTVFACPDVFQVEDPTPEKPPHDCPICGIECPCAKVASLSTMDTPPVDLCMQAYTCPQCELMLPHPWDLSRHMMNHAGQSPREEPRDPMEEEEVPETLTESELEAINAEIDDMIKNSDKATNTSDVDKESGLQGGLHIDVHNHIKDKLYMCQQCDVTLGCPWDVTRHQISHLAEKLLICFHCFLSFSDIESLSAHIKSHSMESESDDDEAKSESSDATLVDIPLECPILAGRGNSISDNENSQSDMDDIKVPVSSENTPKKKLAKEPLPDYIAEDIVSIFDQETHGQYAKASDIEAYSNIQPEPESDEGSESANDSAKDAMSGIMKNDYQAPKLDYLYNPEAPMQGMMAYPDYSNPMDCYSENTLISSSSHCFMTYICSQCELLFGHPWDYSRHMMSHSGQKPRRDHEDKKLEEDISPEECEDLLEQIDKMLEESGIDLSKKREYDIKESEINENKKVTNLKVSEANAQGSEAIEKVKDTITIESNNDEKESEIAAKENISNAKECEHYDKESESNAMKSKSIEKQSETDVKGNETDAKENDTDAKDNETNAKETNTDKSEIDAKEGEPIIKERESKTNESESNEKENGSDAKATVANAKTSKTNENEKKCESDVMESEPDSKENKANLKESKINAKESEPKTQDSDNNAKNNKTNGPDSPKTLSGPKPYGCLTCGLKLSCTWEVTRHQVLHLFEIPVKCNYCKKPFPDPRSLGIHMETHSIDSGDMSSAGGEDAESVASGETYHDEEDEMMEDLDELSGDEKLAYIDSSENEILDGDITDDGCIIIDDDSEEEEMAGELNEEVEVKPENENMPKEEPVSPLRRIDMKYKCPQCKQVENQPWEFTRHMMTHIPDWEPKSANLDHLCETPEKMDKTSKEYAVISAEIDSMFSYSENIDTKQDTSTLFTDSGVMVGGLPIDLQLHVKQKHHQCERCDENIGCPWDLTRHQITHVEKDMLKCIPCDMRFNNKKALFTHLKSHTKMRMRTRASNRRTMKRKYVEDDEDEEEEEEEEEEEIIEYKPKPKPKPKPTPPPKATPAPKPEPPKKQQRLYIPGLKKCIVCNAFVQDLKSHMATHRSEYLRSLNVATPTPLASPGLGPPKKPPTLELTESGWGHYLANSRVKEESYANRMKREHQCMHCDLVFSSPYEVSRHTINHATDFTYREPPEEPAMAKSRTFSEAAVDQRLWAEMKAIDENRDVYHYVENNQKGADKTLYKCSNCDAAFGRAWDLSRHQMTHAWVRCRQCDQYYAIRTSSCPHCTAVNLSRDKPSSSSADEDYTCITCGTNYQSADALSAHLPCNQYQCIYCQAVFTKHYTLLRHLDSHKQRSNHICNTCGERFITEDELNKHLATHILQNPNSSALFAPNQWAPYGQLYNQQWYGGQWYDVNAMMDPNNPYPYNLDGTHDSKHNGV